MPDTDERMEKVFQKASRMERRRRKSVTPVLGALAVLLGVGLLGSIGLFSTAGTGVAVGSLYGSSLMLGGNAGGYVIVAILAAAFAVVVTLLFVNKSKQRAWYDPAEAREKGEGQD